MSFAVAFFLLAIVLGSLAALLGAAPLDFASILAERYLRHVLLFTTAQAALSALLSVGLALPVARALARRTGFPGRTLMLRLFGLPMVMPAVVAVFAIVTLYGESGWLHRLASGLGLPLGSFLYGLGGILIAHVFFNMPFAARTLLARLEAVPGESWRLAAQLGMRGRQVFRLIEWPALKAGLAATAGIVFMLCFASFTVTLTLGGGPAWGSLEAAIYQALRYDFDPPRAAVLALMQLAISACLLVLLHRLLLPAPVSPGIGRPQPRPDADGAAAAALDAVILVVAALFVGLPVAAVVTAGLSGSWIEVLGAAATWRAMAAGIAVAGAAALIATAGGLLLVLGRRPGPLASFLELVGALPLACSPLALGAGLFILLLRIGAPLDLGLGLVALVNGVMGLPFVVRIAAPAAAEGEARHGRLAASLGIAGWDRWRLIDWPLLRRPIGFAAGLVAALAFGDLGAIALFGTPNTATLPLLIYQQLSAYRLDAAAVTSLLLVALALGAFALVERLVGGPARG